MFKKSLTPAALILAAYWFWTGPYQQMTAISYGDELRINAENMTRCVNSREYIASGGASITGTPEEFCAAKYNLYRESGNWHSYDQKRPIKPGRTG